MTAQLPEGLQDLLSSLRKLLGLEGKTRELRVLDAGKLELVEEGYDNWDGGQYFFTLYVDVPLELFVEIENEIVSIEKEIQAAVDRLRRGRRPDYVTSTTIRSISDALRGETASKVIPENIAPGIWRGTEFQLFVSHVSKYREIASALKRHLSPFGVSCFVAHDDIQPTKEWQDEIIAALGSMDALVALLTPDFVDSKWCDQEVGAAIGLDHLVIPLSLSSSPHGFLGKYQALSCGNKTPLAIAKEIATILIRHEKTKLRMASALISRFEASLSFREAKQYMTYLERVPTLTTNAARRIRDALESNAQIANAWNVPSRIESLLMKHGAPR